MTAYKLSEIPISIIANKAGVDRRTVKKFINGDDIKISKSILIKKAFTEVLNEMKEVDKKYNKICAL